MIVLRNSRLKGEGACAYGYKKSPEGKTVAPEDSRSHAEAPRYVPSLPKNSDTKIATISENLKSLEEKILRMELLNSQKDKDEIVDELSNGGSGKGLWE